VFIEWKDGRRSPRKVERVMGCSSVSAAAERKGFGSEAGSWRLNGNGILMIVSVRKDKEARLDDRVLMSEK
jgi:hypothetical protein